jgi:protoporphyrinogen/coproporphyrinogen III oxidase
VLLESGSRVGGRIRSERRGPYWLNWGGHVFAGPGSSTDALLTEAGITAAQVPGSLAGLSMNGKLLLKGRIETYPFRIPMPLSSRIALIKTGIKVGGKAGRLPGAPKPTRNRSSGAVGPVTKSAAMSPIRGASFAPCLGHAETRVTPSTTKCRPACS